MKLINRYLSRVVLTSTLGVLTILAGLDFIFSLVAEIDDIKADYGFFQIINYLLIQLPERMYIFFSVAILVGVLMGLGSLASTSELTVIRAAGISIPKIILSAFKPLLLILIIALLSKEFILPKLSITAKLYKWEKIYKISEMEIIKETELWLKEGNTIFSIDIIKDDNSLHGLKIFTLKDNWELDSLVTAKSAIYKNKQWELNKVRVINFSENKILEETHEVLDLRLPLKTKNLSLLSLSMEQISISQLFYFSKYLDSSGQPSGYYWLAFWKASLLPLTVFSVVLLGASFTFGPLRSVPAGTRVFHGVVIALGVKFAQDLLGPSTILWGISPIFAVLLPAAFCAILGMFFIYKAR